MLPEQNDPHLKNVLFAAADGLKFLTTSKCDIDNSGEIDFGDFLAFFNAYDGERPEGDLNGDGVVDFGDFLYFFNLYDQG
jgi:hypothetical protein